MKYLNLGCGSHFCSSAEWTNLDFTSSSTDVVEHNLLQGIPFEDDQFDFVYNSHVLEHFSKGDGEFFLKECKRVLKKGGVLRIVIPDLEQIILNYQEFFGKGINDLDSKEVWENYNWTLIELFDQMVRNQSGGRMGDYLGQQEMINESFVMERLGEEGRSFRKLFLKKSKKSSQAIKVDKPVSISFVNRVRYALRLLLKGKLPEVRRDSSFEKIGKFRLGGEIHQWMYDRYSLQVLLINLGLSDFTIHTSETSAIIGWSDQNLDSINKIIRKPDSLYVEVRL